MAKLVNPTPLVTVAVLCIPGSHILPQLAVVFGLRATRQRLPGPFQIGIAWVKELVGFVEQVKPIRILCHMILLGNKKARRLPVGFCLS